VENRGPDVFGIGQGDRDELSGGLIGRGFRGRDPLRLAKLPVWLILQQRADVNSPEIADHHNGDQPDTTNAAHTAARLPTTATIFNIAGFPVFRAIASLPHP